MSDNTRPLDAKERWNNPEEATRAAAENQRNEIWTSIPAIVKKHNNNGTLTVQVSVKQRRITHDDKVEWVAWPELQDIPVQYPGGGGASWTFPLKEGDEVLLCCASKNIDKWWKDGGVQEQSQPFRMHQPSDSFAIPGFRSQPRKLSDVSMDKAQLRTDDGGMVLEFDPAGKKITIKSTDNPVRIEGDLNVTGEIRARADAVAAGGGAVGSGAIKLTTHLHSGVQPGGGLTQKPVPGT